MRMQVFIRHSNIEELNRNQKAKGGEVGMTMTLAGFMSKYNEWKQILNIL